MKNVINFRYAVLMICLLATYLSTAQKLVKDFDVSEQEATLTLQEEKNISYFIEIAGPSDYYWKKTIDQVENLVLSAQMDNGAIFPDGQYTLQVTPFIKMSAEQKSELRRLRSEGNEQEVTAFRAKHDLPNNLDVFVVYYRVDKGAFIPSKKRESGTLPPIRTSMWGNDYPELFASTNVITGEFPDLPTDNSLMEDMQVFVTDVIIQGSLCVGIDCSSSENFGSDTERLKENNLRIHFDDTSNSASFPSNDWRLVANDQTNGGASYFAIEDATAGRIPFRVIAGAPANSLYVDAQGDIGIGNANPVVEVHVTDGDSPTMRLEQNGSSGFGSQTWDIAGNETNFFIRDVTNGSLLPFRIKPSAPKNSIFIDSDGDIGLGTEAPTNRLQVESGDVYVKAGNVGIGVVPTVALDILGNVKVSGDPVITGTSTFRGDVNTFLTNFSTFFSALTAPTPFQPVLHVDGANTRVGIGTNAPGHLLELSADDAVKPGGGSWSAPSDRRLKTNIVDFNDGLEKVMQIRPVKFHYNGLLNMPTDQEFIGVIAQEMKEIAPYTVKPLNHETDDVDNYLAHDGSSLTYLLVNAVQEQQELIEKQQKEIENLNQQLAGLEELKATVSQLAKIVNANKPDSATGEAELTSTAQVK